MRAPAKGQGNKIDPAKTDISAALSDALLQRILLAIPESTRAPCALVCHRWLRAVGNLQRTIRVLDWQFLESGRLTQRFPHLTDIDLTTACMQDVPKNNSVLLALPHLVLPIFPHVTSEDKPFSLEACIRSQQVSPESLDRGLAVLASGCPDLQRLRLVDVSSNHGLGGSFSEWEFVSANEKAGQKAVYMLRDLGDDAPTLMTPLRSRDKGVTDGEKAGRDVLFDGENNAVRDGSLDQGGAGEDQKKLVFNERFRKSVRVWKSVPDNADAGEKILGPVTDTGVGEKAERDVEVFDGENEVRDGSLDQGGAGEGQKKAGFNDRFRKSRRVWKSMLDNTDAGEENLDPVTDTGVKNVSSNLDGETTKFSETKGGGDSDGELGKKGGQGKVQEAGLVRLGGGCPMLQELDVYQCTDETVTSIIACPNVQILRLVGTVPGFLNCSFTDVGLTILANRCRRLIRLELSGCEASFAGIAAIGQCCLMLEELTLSSTGFHEGWVAALGCFQSLMTLRLESCKYIDRRPGPSEHIERCQTLERLQLVCCDLRDRVGFAGLLTVCGNIKELEFQNCWGLDDESFALGASCKKLRLLSLDGCSLVTAAGLETVATACKELQRLRVMCCGNIRDSEISPDFGNVVVMLKEFRWRPDTKSLLSSTNAIAQPGRWFFKT